MKIIKFQRKEYIFRDGIFENCIGCPLNEIDSECPHAKDEIDCTITPSSDEYPHQQHQLRVYSLKDKLSEL